MTAAGVAGIEEATRLGVNINATVCFTLPQAIAVAEAVDRGLARRAKEGHDVSNMRPVCTLMIGRLDDWLKVVAKRDGVTITPGHLDWPGIAVIKKAYGIFKARGYRARLLAAAYRHHMHWSELIGGDIILTIPYEWQVLFNKSDIEVKPRMDDPVDPAIVAESIESFQISDAPMTKTACRSPSSITMAAHGQDVAVVHRSLPGSLRRSTPRNAAAAVRRRGETPELRAAGALQ